MLILDFSGEL